MSFNSEGFPDYPNLYLDEQAVHLVAEWTDARHNWKTAQYREFLGRLDILPAHRAKAEYIASFLEFDGDCRDGIYETLGQFATEAMLISDREQEYCK